VANILINLDTQNIFIKMIKIRLIILLFLIGFSFFLYLTLDELMIHLYSNISIEGTVIRIDPPAGEYQHNTYYIEYEISDQKYVMNNTHKISNILKIDDKIFLLVSTKNSSNAVIKDSYRALFFPLFLLTSIVTFCIYAFVKTFRIKEYPARQVND
jgi:hypothetical protein